MNFKFTRIVRDHQIRFASECYDWLSSDKAQNLIGKRLELEERIKEKFSAYASLPLFTWKRIPQYLQLLPLKLQFSLCAIATKLSLIDLIVKFSHHKNALVEETHQYDTPRLQKLANIQSQENPFYKLYNAYIDLVNAIDNAISCVDHAKSHSNSASFNEFTQRTTNDRRVYTSAQFSEAYHQFSLPTAIENAKIAVATVCQKASHLEVSKLSQDWQKLSAEPLIDSFTDKYFSPIRSYKKIAAHINSLDLFQLEGELNQLSNDLTDLRSEAMRPIKAYKKFEKQRKKEMAETFQQAKAMVADYEINNVSMNRIYLKTCEGAFGKNYSMMCFNFKKAAIGASIGLAVSFAACSYFSDSNDNKIPQQPAYPHQPKRY